MKGNVYYRKCNQLTPAGGYKAWQIIVAVCFFPIGLIALDLDKKVTICKHCGYRFQV
jgi:hypothetical protein